jgi:hypothetical protein
MSRLSDHCGYAVIYEVSGRELANYLVVALDERDAQAKASALFFAQHPAFSSIDAAQGLTFRVEKRSPARRWDR